MSDREIDRHGHYDVNKSQEGNKQADRGTALCPFSPSSPHCVTYIIRYLLIHLMQVVNATIDHVLTFSHITRITHKYPHWIVDIV